MSRSKICHLIKYMQYIFSAIFTKTRFNLHNKCFLVIYRTPYASAISSYKIYTLVYHGKLWKCSSFGRCSTVWQIKHETDATVSKYLMTASLERWNIDAKSYSECRKLANFATASAHPPRSLNRGDGADAGKMRRISGILDFSRSNKTMAAAKHVRLSMHAWKDERN